MAWLFAYGWILIPIAGIALGGFKEWLKFKEKQLELGSSTENLEKITATLQTELDAAKLRESALIERIQNLETIVTSEAWEDPLPLPEKKPLLELPDESEEATKEAARLARRMREG